MCYNNNRVIKMKEKYSSAEDCYELAKMLHNKLNNKMVLLTAPYIEVVEGKYNCFGANKYKKMEDYIKDKVIFHFKYLKNEFLRITVGSEDDNHTTGHKLAVLSEFYKVLKEEFKEPTLFYTIKEDNEKTLSLQWSFKNSKEDIENFLNNKCFNDANIKKAIVIDSDKNKNNNIGLPVELCDIIKDNIEDYIEYKKGCLELEKELEISNDKKKILRKIK